MNHSFYSADKMTHLKIVVVALFAAIMVTGITVTASVNASDTTQTARASGPAVKASKPVIWTANDQIIR